MAFSSLSQNRGQLKLYTLAYTNTNPNPNPALLIADNVHKT